MVGTVSVGAQKTTKQTTTQPPTETPTCQPITGNTCQVLQGPPGPPGTCSYTEVSLVKGVRDISTSLKESMRNLTERLRESSNDLRETLQEGLQKLNDGLMDALGKIQQEVAQLKTEEAAFASWGCLAINQPCPAGRSSIAIRLLRQAIYYWIYWSLDNNRIALDDPLWEGDRCGPGNSCCAQAGMPWFCRTLPQKVS